MSDLTLSFGAEETVTPVTEEIADSLIKLTDEVKKTGDEATKTGRKVKDSAEKMSEAEKAGTALADKLTDVARRYRITISEAAHAAEQNEKFAASASSSAAQIVVLNQALELASKAWDLIAVPVRAFAGYVAEGVEAAQQAEQAERALRGALGERGAEVSAVADQVQRATGADADHLKQQGAVLAGFGLTTEQIKAALPALSAYSQVTGKDVTRAVQSLGKAMEDGSVDAKIEQLGRFTEIAAAQAEGFGGASARLTAELGELQEAVGLSVTGSEDLAESLSLLTDEATDATKAAGALGPVLGDSLAVGLQATAEALQLAATAAREFLEPTTALSGLLAGMADTIVPGASAQVLRLWQAFNGETAGQAAAGLDAIAGRAAEVSEALEEIADKSRDLAPMDLSSYYASIARAEGGDPLADKKRKDREKAATDAKAAKEKEANDSAEWWRQIQAREAKEQQKEIERARDFDAGLTEIAEEYEKEQRDVATRAAKIQAVADKREAAAAIKLAEQEQEAILDTIGNVQAYASAGSAAMDGFLAAMHGKTEQERRGGMLSTLGTIIGAIAGGLTAGPAGILAGAGAGGSVGSFLGKFRDGGPITALPKARGGALVIGDDMDADGRLIEGHVGEVMLNRGAVNRNGGASEVNKQNTGMAPPLGRGRGGGDTYLEINSLDPQTALAAAKRQLEPISVRRMENRQGRLTSTLGRRLRRNRSR